MQRLVFHILYQDQDFIIQSDLFRRIQLPFHPHCVMISLGKLVDAANAFLDTFFALHVVDRRLLQCSGTEGRSAPSTAERLQEVVQLMRTPKTASTRRLAPLPTTQEANHGGTHWATAVVAGQCGEMFYRQRVDPATDARYCMECCAKLADGGQGSPPLEKIVDRFSHIGEGFTLTLRYAFVVELFCSGECYHTFFVIRRSGASRKELFMLEDGVCRSCKVHTQRVREALGCLPTEEASEHYFEASGGATDNERNMFERLSRKRQQRVISSTPGHLWEADHTLAVAEGGGEAELNNLQTLCLACHYEKTRCEAKRRADLRRASSAWFCYGECHHTFFVIRRSGAAKKELFVLEGGVCRSCKVDTERMREALGRLPTEEAREHYFEASCWSKDSGSHHVLWKEWFLQRVEIYPEVLTLDVESKAALQKYISEYTCIV